MNVGRSQFEMIMNHWWLRSTFITNYLATSSKVKIGLDHQESEKNSGKYNLQNCINSERRKKFKVNVTTI